ncbi:kielin/chordin-like protein [Nematostella vectensis]|uniref:kielin/chordin-like protein n=1 Tax=Nematostella vectensis TaxID=45351 RepID=UPI002076FDF0|nr:kielin/chordin-like protein [Nematostella vectensis]
MWYFQLVCVCLLAAFSHSMEIVDKEGNRVVSLGCYRDIEKSRAMGIEPYFNAREKIIWKTWPDLSYIVKICMEEALARNITIFGIQNYGECWGSADSAPDSYSKYGASGECINGVGQDFTNQVYSIVPASCELGGKKYPDKSQFYVPQNPVNQRHPGCDVCTCKRGRSDCKQIHCDLFFPCDNLLPASPNECCPKCECSHRGQKYANGKSWTNKPNEDTCFQCRCIKGFAQCTRTECSRDCPNPEPIPGQCCPICRPGAPTTRPWEILPPTKRPHPTWPMWGKRSYKSAKKRRATKQ